eukprot:31157-Pelagococcus_subviridis.AAC.18
MCAPASSAKTRRRTQSASARRDNDAMNVMSPYALNCANGSAIATASADATGMHTRVWKQKFITDLPMALRSAAMRLKRYSCTTTRAIFPPRSPRRRVATSPVRVNPSPSTLVDIACITRSDSAFNPTNPKHVIVPRTHPRRLICFGSVNVPCPAISPRMMNASPNQCTFRRFE